MDTLPTGLCLAESAIPVLRIPDSVMTTPTIDLKFLWCWCLSSCTFLFVLVKGESSGPSQWPPHLAGALSLQSIFISACLPPWALQLLLPQSAMQFQHFISLSMGHWFFHASRKHPSGDFTPSPKTLPGCWTLYLETASQSTHFPWRKLFPGSPDQAFLRI